MVYYTSSTSNKKKVNYYVPFCDYIIIKSGGSDTEKQDNTEKPGLHQTPIIQTIATKYRQVKETVSFTGDHHKASKKKTYQRKRNTNEEIELPQQDMQQKHC